MLRVSLVLGVVSAMVSQPAFAQASPFVGTWQLNRAQSQLAPGEPPSQTLVASIQRADAAHVRWTTTTRNGADQATVESFDVPGNGEFYPISEDTTAAVTVSDQTLKATFKGPNGEVDTLSCTMASGGRRMSCAGSVAEEDGRTSPYVDVFDRK